MMNHSDNYNTFIQGLDARSIEQLYIQLNLAIILYSERSPYILEVDEYFDDGRKSFLASQFLKKYFGELFLECDLTVIRCQTLSSELIDPELAYTNEIFSIVKRSSPPIHVGNWKDLFSFYKRVLKDTKARNSSYANDIAFKYNELSPVPIKKEFEDFIHQL